MAIAWVLDEKQDALAGIDTSTWLRPPEVWARYQWDLIGSCFKCEKSAEVVAVVGDSIWDGQLCALTMCQSCVYRLYLKHLREAYGLPPLPVVQQLFYDPVV
ncbi:hypothetical protein ACPC54_18595 [Kitasatospora sp. NPDC094028]